MMNAKSLKLYAQTDLAFSTWKILESRTYRRSCAFESLNRGCVVAVKKIEHFEEHLSLHMLSDSKALADAQVHVDESRRGLVITTQEEIVAVDQAVAVHVYAAIGWGFAVVEAALGAEDAG
jgi:hypothetical protein